MPELPAVPPAALSRTRHAQRISSRPREETPTMPKTRRFALRSLAIVAVVLVVSLAFLHHSAKSGAQAAGVDS